MSDSDIRERCFSADTGSPGYRCAHPGYVIIHFKIDRRLQIVVVDHDVGLLLWRTFGEVSPLAADITLMRRRGGIDRIEALAARRATRQRDVEIDFQKYRKVPTGSQLGTMQKNAVDDQRRRRFGVLRIQIERLVIVEIKSLRNVLAGAAGAQGLEQQPPERIVVIGIEIKAVRRISAARIAKAFADCENHPPRRGSPAGLLRGNQRRQRIRQCRLAGAIDAVDGNANSSIGMKAGNGVGEAGKQRCVRFAHAAFPLTACWAARGPAACGCRGRSGY